MAIRWGTDSKIQYVDPTYKFPLSIGASGEMTLSVENSRKLLIKLVGTETQLDRQRLVSYFRGVLMTKVKTYMAQTMRQSAINIFEIDEQLEEFSREIHSRLIDDFLEYGINLSHFYVTTVVKPDGDPQYERFKELHFRQYADIAEAKLRQQTDIIHAQTEAQKVVIDSQAQATKRQQEGYTYQQERGFDVAQDAAKNESAGQFTNMGIGLGMMTGVGGVIANVVGGAVNTAFNGAPPSHAVHPQTNAVAFCENCGAKLTPSAVFCDECGTKVSTPDNICINCGYQFERPGKFCPKCGTKRGS